MMYRPISKKMKGVSRPSRFTALRWISPALAVMMIWGLIGAAGASASGQGASGSKEAGPSATCPGTPAQCFTDVLPSNPFYAFINSIYQQDLVTGYPCGGLGEPCDPDHRPYYRPANSVTRGQMAKFIDNARHLPQLDIEADYSGALVVVSNTTGIGVHASSPNNWGVAGDSINGYGVRGSSPNGVGVVGTTITGTGVIGTSTYGGWGVYGESASAGVVGHSTGLDDYSAGVVGSAVDGNGVSGDSQNHFGVWGTSENSNGVFGVSTNGVGVYGVSSNDIGVFGFSEHDDAGYFDGHVTITGTCTGCLGVSQIDDPLDPATKYLYNSAVESPDMLDIYNGNVTTDANGEAVVTLPDYFEALNRDFRYQLTPVGQFAQAIVWQEIKDNRFVIKTDKPGVKVSWMVTGIRNDPYSQQHPVTPEVNKPAGEQGTYLHPGAYGQPESKALTYQLKQQLSPGSGTTRP